MLTEKFNVVVADRVEKIRQVLESKAGEYASEGDRLHNFKIAAAADGTTAVRALFGMYLKHFVSVKDIVDSFNPHDSRTWPSVERIDEKIGDSINYMILLEGLLLETLHQEDGMHLLSSSTTGSANSANSVTVVDVDEN